MTALAALTLALASPTQTKLPDGVLHYWDCDSWGTAGWRDNEWAEGGSGRIAYDTEVKQHGAASLRGSFPYLFFRLLSGLFLRWRRWWRFGFSDPELDDVGEVDALRSGQRRLKPPDEEENGRGGHEAQRADGESGEQPAAHFHPTVPASAPRAASRSR